MSKNCGKADAQSFRLAEVESGKLVFILPIHNLAEAKGPVMDSLEKSGPFNVMAERKVFMSTHDAIRDLDHGCPPKT